MKKDKAAQYFQNIGGVDNKVFGVGIFGDGGDFEIGYRHYLEVQHIKSIIQLNKNISVLELGCGNGRFALSIAPLVKKYVGIDISGVGLEIARNNCEIKGLNNTKFIQGSVIDFSLEEKFDVVYFGSVLQYLTDEQIIETLMNLKKVTKEDTIILDRATIRKKHRYISNTIMYYCQYRTSEEYSEIFKKCGLSNTYQKRSYDFIKGGYIIKKLNNNFLLSRFINYNLIRKFSLVLEKYIFKNLNNYISHDFFIYKIN